MRFKITYTVKEGDRAKVVVKEIKDYVLLRRMLDMLTWRLAYGDVEKMLVERVYE